VIVAKRHPTRVVGGEFWLLAADPISPVLHCKRIANRTQLLKFDAGADAAVPTEISTTPVLRELPEVDEINPFLLGHEELLSSFR
jgi:hypothetical protein